MSGRDLRGARLRSRSCMWGGECGKRRLTGCIISPRTALKENYDTRGAGVRIVLGNEERKVLVFAKIFDQSCCIEDVPMVERSCMWVLSLSRKSSESITRMTWRGRVVGRMCTVVLSLEVSCPSCRAMDGKHGCHDGPLQKKMPRALRQCRGV